MSFRSLFCAMLLCQLSLLSGCAWNAERWNLDNYRDSRSVEIEDHLTRDEPIVESPF